MNFTRFALIASALALSACQRESVAETNGTDDALANAAIVENDVADLANSSAAQVDSAFVTDAIKGDNGEVAIGKLAAAKASKQAAKDFGQMLVADHGSHKQKLVALASKAGIPATEDPSDEAKTNLEKLEALQGAEFDKEFKRMMVADHQKDIAKYEKQAASGDAETSALAKETLPTLRKHLETAQGL